MKLKLIVGLLLALFMHANGREAPASGRKVL